MPEQRNIPVTFSSFVVSLAQSAMVQLGEVAHPITQAKETDLPLARQTIDLLGLLQDKTKGNLDDEEGQLLESVLYDLRKRFVDRT